MSDRPSSFSDAPTYQTRGLGITQSNIYEVFKTKLMLNLKAEASRTYLGYLWWVLEPTLYVCVLYLVFNYLIDRGTQDFVAFLLCGTIPFLWFSKTIANATASILDSHVLISSLRIPKPFFPLLIVFQDSVKQAFVFTLLFLFLLLYGTPVSVNWWYVLPVIFVQLGMIIAAALSVAAITPWFPDFKFVVPTGLLLLMLSSGVFYSYQTLIPEARWDTFLLNPMANLIDNYRRVLLDGVQPDWLALLSIAAFSVVVSIIVLSLLRRYDATYNRLVIQ